MRTEKSIVQFRDRLVYCLTHPDVVEVRPQDREFLAGVVAGLKWALDPEAPDPATTDPDPDTAAFGRVTRVA